ncbi:MAG: AI-2E family transporter [Candidatus Magasanikbacteria bacterium]|nr:AI-2E family transporter [Candidatus Magasanikbacteria bacterium]
MDFSKMRSFLFLTLLAVVTITFIWIIKTFAFPIFWAAIIAAVFYPIYKAIDRKLKVPNLSTAITMMMILIIIVVPLVTISILVVNESLNLYTSITTNGGQINESVRHAVEWVRNNPFTAQLNIDQTFWTEKFSEMTRTITGFLLTSAKELTQNSIIFAIMFMITFYTLFFFIRDGEKLLKTIMHLCPLGDDHEKMLYSKFTSTTRATIKGSLIVGLIQGTLGWLMFVIAGIPGALIWGLLMVLLASVPGIGPYFVWLPAAIIMIALGNTWTGIFMILFGALVIGTIDNILRPILVGKDSQMHPLMVLLSTLGGIAVFGISGFIIGPIIASLMLAFWEMYEHSYRKELDKN